MSATSAVPGRASVAAQLRTPLVRSTTALVASGVLTTLLGLAFWAVAARLYPVADVGRASSAISAMTMLVALLQLNLTTGLMRFLPDAGNRAGHLLVTAYAVTTVTTALGGAAVVLGLGDRGFLAGLGPDRLAFGLLFALAVPVWSLFVLQDAALTGLRAAVYVPAENLVFAVAKILLLVVLAGWPAVTLLLAWILPAAVLLIPVSVLIGLRLLPRCAHRPATVRRWRDVRRFLAQDYGGSFLETLTAAAVPVLVTWRLGLEPGAYFYTCWVALVGSELVLGSIGSSLIVEGAHDRRALTALHRSAGRLTAVFALAVVVVGVPAAPLVLGVVGPAYAAHGTTLLRLLLLAVPLRAIVVLQMSRARVERRGVTVLAYQAGYAVLLFAGCWYGLRSAGIEAVGWAFLATQAVLAGGVLAQGVAHGLARRLGRRLARSVRRRAGRPLRRAAGAGLERARRGAHPLHDLGERFWSALAEDLSWGVRDLLVNRVAGSVLMPRMLRFVAYRAAGLDVRTPNVYPGCTFVGAGRVHLGEDTFVNRDCYFEAVSGISIGAGSAIGMQSMFVTSSHPFGPDGHFAWLAEGRSVRVGNRCWIGARVTVLPGVTIGDDVVVAAGAVVTRDCLPGGLYAGVPAQRVRELTPGEGCEP
jgi:acetyltransferase-like isoleucine patch superfamily enzyme/O-antigen/teichoic acid export membrane protein